MKINMKLFDLPGEKHKILRERNPAKPKIPYHFKLLNKKTSQYRVN